MNRPLVFGEGPKDAKIVLLGEAPGREEIIQGRPFAEAPSNRMNAGKLLNSILRRAGLNRFQCYVTNVVKEHPPNDDFSTFVKHTSSGSTLSKEYLEYEASLYQEILGINPNVVVAIGNNALFALTRMRDITKRRGSILESRIIRNDGSPIKVIPTLHPAGIIRAHSYLQEHWVAMDLKRACQESSSPALNLLVRDIRTEPLFADALQFIEGCRDSVGFDIETSMSPEKNVGEVSCFSLARSPTDIMSIPMMKGGSHYWSIDQETEIWTALGKLLETPEVVKVGHYIIFDAGVMFRRFGIVTRNMRDTMIAHAIIHPDFPHDLGFVSSMFTREPYFKDERHRTEEEFWRYNAKDAAVTLEMLPKLLKTLESQGNLETYYKYMTLVEPLIYIQEIGQKVDIERLKKLSWETEGKIATLLKDLWTLVGRELNPNSNKQLATYFYVEKGIAPYIDRKTKAVTVDHDALVGLHRKGERAASLIIDIRGEMKLKSTYLDVNLTEDNRLRGHFNPVGTTSGRLSSSTTVFGEGTNKQNLPMEVKGLLLADDGYIMYELDLEQAENRVVAYIAPDLNMIKAFEEGVDIHKQTASFIFGKAPGDVNSELGSSSLGNGMQSERYWGKKANHALNYGLGVNTFAIKNDLPVAQAKWIMSKYFEAYPGVLQYHSWIQEALSKGRKLTGFFGRSRLFLDTWGDDLFREAYSFIPQNVVAEITNFWGLVYVYEHQDIFDFGDVVPLSVVHDSLTIQIPISNGFVHHARCLDLIRTSLNKTLSWKGITFRIPVSIKMGISGDKMVDIEKGSLEECYQTCLNPTTKPKD